MYGDWWWYATQGGLVDFLQCSQLSGLIPRPPKGHATEAGESGFYSIFVDKRKACRPPTRLGSCTCCNFLSHHSFSNCISWPSQACQAMPAQSQGDGSKSGHNAAYASAESSLQSSEKHDGCSGGWAQGQDAQRVKDFLMEHTPHVVAVGGGGLEARQLKTDLDAIRDSILETNARVMTGQETGVPSGPLSAYGGVL